MTRISDVRDVLHHMPRSLHPVMLLNLVSILVALGAVVIPESTGVEQRPLGKLREALLTVAEVKPGPAQRLADTQPLEYLRAVGLMVAEGFRSGEALLRTCACGMCRTHMAGNQTDSAATKAVPDSGRPSALQRYRLWRARETAIKQQNERAILQLARLLPAITTARDWDADRQRELQQLISQLQERLKLAPTETLRMTFESRISHSLFPNECSVIFVVIRSPKRS